MQSIFIVLAVSLLILPLCDLLFLESPVTNRVVKIVTIILTIIYLIFLMKG